MEKSYAILAQFATHAINVFDIHTAGDNWVVEYEYRWDDNPAKPKWAKAVFIAPGDYSPEQLLTHLYAEVEAIRNELGYSSDER